jgi:RNA polymerase sigma-70 factor (ECF subfamily)
LREPRAYLTTIAHGLMVNLFRRRDIERAYLDSLALVEDAFAPSPERRALALEALIEIDRLLDGLPAKVRKAFLLAQLEGLRHGEIAERMQVSVSSVRQYLARAMQHCLAAW